MQSKILKVLFWTVFWGGNLLIISVLIFSDSAAYFYPVGYENGQVTPPQAPEFIRDLEWGGYVFTYFFYAPILVSNLIFVGYLAFIKKQNAKIGYNFFTIVLSLLAIGYCTVIFYYKYFR